MSWHPVLRATLAAAGYGLSIGAVHSRLFAMRNVIKFPLLILVTATVCSVCYYVLARWIAPELTARAVARSTFTIFHDAAVLLVSFAPVTLFLARTIRRPDASGLHEYPLFLSVNVALVALSGSLALVRQCRQLVRDHNVSRSRSRLLVIAWLASSLFVGAQVSWFLRPFCGVVGFDTPFMLGSAPDFRGATSFYEALLDLIGNPPPVRSR